MADVKITADSFKPVASTMDSSQQEKIAAKSLTFTQDAMRRLRKNKAAMISLYILIILIFISVLSLWVSPHNPNAQNPNFKNLAPKIGNLNIPGFNGYWNSGAGAVDTYARAGVPKGTYYIFGTDYLGRDLLSRTLVGVRVSLFIAFMATLFDLTIGLFYGLISGWKGGRTDTIMQRIIEIVSSVPNLVVVILMLLVFKPGMTSIILAIGMTGWITMARLIRAQTMQLKDQEFILAAKTLGEKPSKIAFKHLIPNLSSVIIIQTMFTIPNAIFFEAFLSYIGIGIPAPIASLGTLLSDGQKAFRFFSFQLWIPAIFIVIIMLAFNLLADGLRDAFDPKTLD